MTCTLTEEVESNPELVQGEFSFDVTAVEATTEDELIFDLNGRDDPVELPGDGGIDDGVEIPDDWGKSGEMNDDNWSMTWTIDLPGSRMQGQDVVNIADTLGEGHLLCVPSKLKVETVRGSTVTDVTDIADITPGVDDEHFTIGLTGPEPDGFDPYVTYRITYDTCTPDGQIDPEDTEYTNEASIDVWGESSGIIGVHPDPWHGDLSKSGTVLGGGDRNGKIAWTVTVPGDQLVGKDGFNFTEKLGAGHELCTDTISGIKITERYGPSSQLERDVTGMLTPNVGSSSEQAFNVNFEINTTDLVFQPSDYRYVITYTTCVTDTNLPEGGTGYTNEVNVDGQVVGTEATVPARTDEKNGSINAGRVTIDGVEHLPQTTLNWNITVPGERISEIESDLVVTDTISGAHELCVAGDPSEGLASRLGLKIEARDQIQNGGLTAVDLTDSVVVAHDNGELTFTIPQPTLPIPGGTEETGFSAEYQYVISYTTCTSSGGMDAPGTVYGNSAEVAGKTYEKSVTQNNRGSGSGAGMPRGTVAISKSLLDNAGAEFVPEGAEFTVHVQEIDPNGVVQVEYDLAVPLGGDPVSGPNSRGTGWTVVMSEPTFPSFPGVTFGSPVFADGDGVTVGDNGTTATAALTPGQNITVNLANDAQLGAISLEKVLEGGAADLVDPERAFEVTATIDTSALGVDFPAQADRVVDLTVDEPVVLDDLPIGATVTLSEAVPADDDMFTWGAPVFSPESVTVTAEHATTPAGVTLTNYVERTVGTFALVKTITGEQAGNPAVPAEVTVTATWDQDGTLEERVLTIPTDGTSVEFGENLLIGTEVTLTEAPLEDGSSIAWSAPVWSGSGVTVSGESAIVTIGRDAQATVNLENHAATSIAGISLIKGIAGEAAGEVDPSTEFLVTATWTDKDGDQAKDLLINSVEPTPLGEDVAAGTVVTITEGERPGIDTVIWGSITISGENVTDTGEGSAEIVVSEQQGDMTFITVTNEATWAPGTFSLSKNVTGVLLDHPDVPENVSVTASWLGDGDMVSKTLLLPIDGTVVPFGQELPHGTEITLSEERLEGSPAFTWDSPAWDSAGIVANQDGTASIVIGAAQDTAVSLTNNATATLGSVSVVKVLSGDAASSVSSGTEFPVTARWTDLLGNEKQADLKLKAGTPTTIENLPLGTTVTLKEESTHLPANVKWLGGTWSSDAAAAVIDGDGNTVSLTVTGSAGTKVGMLLDNEFEKVSGLAVTGGMILSGGLVALTVLLLGGGLVVMVMRKRQA